MSSASENLLLDKLLPNKETIYGIAFYGMSTLDSYTVLDKLGEGTFGTVTKCVLKERRSKLAMPSSASSSASLLSLRTSGISDKPGRLVALKRVIIHDLKEGFPITALREVTILKQLRHKNILPLLDIAHERDAKLSNDKREHANFFLVSPYMKSDLSGLLNNPDIKFNEAIMKCFLKQLLEGLNYLHHKKYYHRDIKTANLLVDHNGVLKIADFGLARKYYGHAPLPQGGPSEVRAKYTGLVVTRWYRAPELLLGDRKYTTAIDMWGVGCIFGELFETRPIIMGKTDLDQLIQIFQLLGEPNDQNYPEFRNLPNPLNAAITHYNPTLKLRFEGYFETSDSRTHGMDLLSKLLHLNPMTRYNAEQALKHRYFSSLPYPLEHYQLPKFMESHEMDNKRFKMEKARREKLQQTPNFSSAQRRLFPENAGNRYNSGNHGYNKLHRARLNGVNNSYDSDLRYEDTLKKAPVGNTSWTKQRSNNTAYEQKESRRKLWDAANHVRDNSPAPPWESKDNSSMLEMLGLALKKLKPQQESANSVSAISELNVEMPKKAITAHDVPVKSSRSQDESKQSAGLHKPRSNEPLKPRVSKPTSSVLFARQTSRPGSSKTAVQKPSLVSILNKMKDKGSDLISISQDKPERAKPLRSIKDEVGLTSRPKKDISSSTLTDPENVSKSSIFSKAVDETKTSHSAEISTIENSATKNSSQKPLSIENNTDNNIEASPTTQRPTSPRRLRSSRRLRHEQPSSPSDSGNAEDDAKEKSRDSEVSSASVDSATKRKALFSGPGRNKKKTKP